MRKGELDRFPYDVLYIYIYNDLQTYTKNIKIQKSKIVNLRFRSRLVELLFDYKIKGSLKCFDNVMYSVTEFKRKIFMLSVNPYLGGLFRGSF